MLTWHVSHPPVPVRAGVDPVGFAVASFLEPATSPLVIYMYAPASSCLSRGLEVLDGLWTCGHWDPVTPPPTIYLCHPLPSQGLPVDLPMPSPFPAGLGPGGAFVRRCSMLYSAMLALYSMLQRRAVAYYFWALDERRSDRVMSAAATGMNMAAPPRTWDATPPSPGRAEMDRQVKFGVKRIDLMEGWTRWDGLEGSGTDEWVLDVYLLINHQSDMPFCKRANIQSYAMGWVAPGV
ncbi:hypothetical protein JB92DRAFT_3234827 [Gautieria morchelliformis]|nr:hypothetical protein JB92DRAFT_3234827 [Gautieria morchelliformis]